MLTREELLRIARLRGLNLGQAELDYYQYIVLFSLYKNLNRELVFKGGTALNKCYGLNRFSQDLDFNLDPRLSKPRIIENVLKQELKNFLTDFDLQSTNKNQSYTIMIRIKGPLYAGIKQSLCSLRVELSLREHSILEPLVKTIGRFLIETPSFDVIVMQEKEILSEKIRAITTRNYARDVYDAWFLIKKGIHPNLSLVKKKLGFYNKKFSEQGFIKKLREKQSFWEQELKPLINNKLPSFKQVERDILKSLKSSN